MIPPPDSRIENVRNLVNFTRGRELVQLLYGFDFIGENFCESATTSEWAKL